ncbi:MAG TPA: 4-hydroxythreonine-4-phosphate dehydrogenase PdxA, partial [Thermoplasmataceae archaeon]|nr:4-hydroxythreonine-4-phosphate dehydrogenase PdxA [Thermoplasmataceae archaeon]
DEIIPAIKRAKAEFDVEGPIPADSVFHQAASGRYDIVLSMYHDQGHIAAKMLNFSKTVSMNLGLPFLRTSVDHGTAFDIAGKGIADHTSMKEAILKCIKYSPAYREKLQKNGS